MPAPSTALPAVWIDRLFERLLAFYGAKFADQWSSVDPDALKAVWATELAGLSADELRRGLDGCRARPWPPTLPEFLALCRPPLDYAGLYAAAQALFAARRVGRHDPRADPLAFWAGVAYGSGDLALPHAQVAARWRTAVDAVREERALAPPPPPAPALPAPPPSPAAPRRLAAAARAVRPDPDHRAWTRRLLERAAAGEPLPPLAVQYAREAAVDDAQTRPHQTAQDAPEDADGYGSCLDAEIVDCGRSHGLPAACGEGA